MQRMKSSGTIIWTIACTLLFGQAVGNGCAFAPRAASFELSSEMLEYSLTAVELSVLTYEKGLWEDARNGDTKGYDSLQVWHDFDNADLALLATRKGVCYAAFRGTIITNVRDVVQLIAESARYVGNCTVRRGFYQAYHTRYFEEFRAAVDECMQTSSQLILTGQSQGGSNAVVAYLELQEYDPIALTFGAVRAVKSAGDCSDFSRVYRFATVSQGMYDKWVNRFVDEGHHVGQTILLDAAAIAPAAYLGLNDDRTNTPTTDEVHPATKYRDGVISMLNSSCNPVELSGWEDGHWCNYDDECDSESCVLGVCTGTLKEGEECENNFECASQRCSYNWFLVKACT